MKCLYPKPWGPKKLNKQSMFANSYNQSVFVVAACMPSGVLQTNSCHNLDCISFNSDT